MFRSPFFRRILLVVVASVLIFAVLTMTLYTTLSRRRFRENTVTSLIDLAMTTADTIRDSGVLAIDSQGRLLSQFMEAWQYQYLNEAQALILSDAGGMIYPNLNALRFVNLTLENSVTGKTYRMNGDQLEAALPEIRTKADIAFQGQPCSHKMMKEYDVVSAPLESVNGHVTSVIVLIKHMSENAPVATSMENTLFYAMLIGFPFIFMMATFASLRVIYPINQMRNVALCMAGGDFSSRAIQTEKDEVGQLGLALNTLASQLSRTLSDLILERNRLRQLINGLNEGILAVDAKGEITHYNPSVLKLCGVKGQAEPHDRAEFIPLPTLWEDFDQAIEEDSALVHNIKLDDRILRIQITPLSDEQGGMAGAVGLVRDITESERLEQTRRDYVANVSHELRTPLSRMRGMIEPLHDGLIREEADRQRYYSLMLGETMRLSRLINDLLELSRLQSGSIALDRHSFPLEELLHDVAEKYAPLATDKGLTFTLDVGELPEVYSNPDRIEEVLVILLDNALKFTKPGDALRIAAHADEECVRVSVRDTGVGIAKGDIEHLFERFYKADKAHSGNGTGLGLSIAREVLEQLGESINVRSELGKGSEFEFTVHFSEMKEALA